MYFTIAFDIQDENPQRQAILKNSIKSTLEGLHWVKPISNYYIAKCSDERIRLNIRKKLVELNTSSGKKFRFVMSPLIDSGSVTGVTNKNLWPNIKDITQSNAIDDFLEE